MSNLNYELLKNALDASSLRQEAISSNIANVNTANYKVNQVVFESLLGKAQQRRGHDGDRRLAHGLFRAYRSGADCIEADKHHRKRKWQQCRHRYGNG